MSDFPLYLNTVAGGLDRRDQTICGFSFVVKIYAVPVVEIIDKFMDDNSGDNTNRSGWEPTDNTSTKNSVLSLMMIDGLINEVSIKYPEAKAIFSLLMEDPHKSAMR